MRQVVTILLLSIPFLLTSQADITKGEFLGLSKPLAELEHVPVPDMNTYKKKFKNDWKNIPNFSEQKPMPTPNAAKALPQNGDPLLQMNRSFPAIRGEITIDLDLEGTNQAQSGVLPPDPDGDNGPNHYIQAVNGSGTTIRVWDKQGNLVGGPMSLNGLWSQFNVGGLGDPIIVYDQLYDRWILTEFQANGNALLVAVSETEDPMGSYYSYRFPTPNFPDYPKFGLWNDALFITSNEGFEPFIPIYVIDREDLMNGVETDMIRLSGFDKVSTGAFIFEIATPAEYDGDIPPPEGTPHYNLRLIDDAWGSGEPDGIQIWEAYYDKENPSNSRMEGPIFIELEAFDSDLCGNSIFNCIDQPGPGTVSALQHVIFNRIQYRNFVEYEVMLGTFSVDIGGNIAGIRWFELRRYPGGEWELYQEGTYAPTETQSRIQPAIAMDGAKNIALAYTIVDPDSTYLGLRVTGRLEKDELGTMSFEESFIVEGGSDNPFQRWGDYTSLSVDPVDEETFWYTGEYMLGNGNWATKVVRFSIKAEEVDLGASALISPQSSQNLTAAETVMAEFRNLGLTDQDNFRVGLIVDGNLIVEDEVNLTIEEASTYTHTFSQTVDMDEIRPYEFEIYVDVEGDLEPINDRINPTVTKLPRFDAAITAVDGIDDMTCGQAVNPEVRVDNLGEEVMTSFLLDATMNGVTQTFEYTGSLAKGDSYTHTFAFDNLEMGENTIEYLVYNPNGMMDEFNVNDNASSTFTFDPSTERLSLSLEPDFYSSETRWELVDENGVVVLSDNYATNDIGLQLINLCSEEKCFTFTMYDSYGDGWSWGGNPFMEWVDEAGNILAKLDDPDFGSEISYEFCFPFECNVEIDAQITDASSAGDSDGMILVNPVNGIPPFSYTLNGEDQGSQDVYNDLAPGDYTITIEDANGCTASADVSVGFVSSNSDIKEVVDVKIMPNPNDGFFRVEIQGLGDVYDLKASLIDAQGKIILDRQFANYSGVQYGQFTTKNIPSGQYYLRVKDDRVRTMYKLIKN